MQVHKIQIKYLSITAHELFVSSFLEFSPLYLMHEDKMSNTRELLG